MTRRHAQAALAALCLAALSACGSKPDPAADAAANAQIAADRVMMNSMDGSAASAVGDMMADPAIRDQLGMSSGAASPAPAPTPAPSAVPPAAAQVEPMAAPMAGAADEAQVRALVLCRAMRETRAGRSFSTGPADDDRARRDLAADPNALAACQAG